MKSCCSLVTNWALKLLVLCADALWSLQESRSSSGSTECAFQRWYLCVCLVWFHWERELSSSRSVKSGSRTSHILPLHLVRKDFLGISIPSSRHPCHAFFSSFLCFLPAKTAEKRSLFSRIAPHSPIVQQLVRPLLFAATMCQKAVLCEKLFLKSTLFVVCSPSHALDQVGSVNCANTKIITWP